MPDFEVRHYVRVTFMSKAQPLPAQPPAADTWLVACLCAEWCATCRAFRTAFDALSARHAGVRFRWIDIEDEADLVDDIEVDSFPTLVIQRSRDVLFFGTILPNAAIIERQLAVLQDGPAAASIDAPDLLARLMA